MSKRNRIVLIALAVAFVSPVVAGCSDYNDERGWGDAPVGKHDDGKWDVINSPNEFPNVATRCNPYEPGTRIYIVTHGKTDVPPVIREDAACGGGR